MDRVVRNRGALRNALYARRNEAIGCVVADFCNYVAGSFVFVRDEGETFTVEMPLHPDEVEAERVRGSLITTTMTMIYVPKKYIRVVLEPGELYEARLETHSPRA